MKDMATGEDFGFSKSKCVMEKQMSNSIMIIRICKVIKIQLKENQSKKTTLTFITSTWITPMCTLISKIKILKNPFTS